MLTEYPLGTPIPLPDWLLRRYWVLHHLYQQHEMYNTNIRRCDDRIVSIGQPYLRPIIRRKQGKTVEFGATINVSLTGEGLAHFDKLHWDAQHESCDLEAQVEATKNVTAIILKLSLLTHYRVPVTIQLSGTQSYTLARANHWNVHQRLHLKTKMR